MYLDSCVFIAGFGVDPNADDMILAARKVLALCDSGMVRGFASTLVISECGKSFERIEALLDGAADRFECVAVDTVISKMSVGLQNSHNLKPVDAIHLATAIRHECQQFFTFDGPILKCKGRLGPLDVLSPEDLISLQPTLGV